METQIGEHTTTAPASPSQSSFVFPTTFDTSLGNNFTNQSCPDFFQSFLKDDAFVSCYPMSFFLENSKSYVTVVRQGPKSVETFLNASCAADFNRCSALMEDLSQQLTQTNTCAHDFDLENPLVTQAYDDFRAYQVIFQSTCLPFPRSNSTLPANLSSPLAETHYCYTHSLYDLTNMGDAYLYLMPLGIPYPNVSAPSCSVCTSQIMDIFYNYTGSHQNPISFTYDSAALRIENSNCSANFINDSAKPLPSSTPVSSAKAKNAASTVRILSLAGLLLPIAISIALV